MPGPLIDGYLEELQEQPNLMAAQQNLANAKKALDACKAKAKIHNARPKVECERHYRVVRLAMHSLALAKRKGMNEENSSRSRQFQKNYLCKSN
jgi:hypothetical protein